MINLISHVFYFVNKTHFKAHAFCDFKWADAPYLLVFQHRPHVKNSFRIILFLFIDFLRIKENLMIGLISYFAIINYRFYLACVASQNFSRSRLKQLNSIYKNLTSFITLSLSKFYAISPWFDSPICSMRPTLLNYIND